MEIHFKSGKSLLVTNKHIIREFAEVMNTMTDDSRYVTIVDDDGGILFCVNMKEIEYVDYR